MSEPQRTGRPTALAPHHLRLFALLLDYSVALALLELWQKLTVPTGWDLLPQTFLERSITPEQVAAVAALLVVRDIVAGRSPGKWLCGIAATRAAAPGTAPSFPARLLRNVTLVLLPVEAVLVFVDPYCRRLGDRLAGTVVVLVPAPMPLHRRLIALSVIVLSFSLAFALVMRRNVFRSAVYTTAVQAVRSDPTVTDTVGAVTDVGGDAEIKPDPDVPDQALVTLTAEGARGEAEVVVVLRMDRPAKAWHVRQIRLGDTDRKPPPTGAPAVQEAPRKP